MKRPESRLTPSDVQRLWRPDEIAALFRVDTSTVRRWVRDGHLTPLHTPGSQNRFLPEEVYALLTAREERAVR